MSGVRLLTPATNDAVVQMEGRKFPGVVVQGDSLNSLISLLETVQRKPEEAAETIAEVLERLKSARFRYEAVCKAEGLNLPYPPRS